ncbi:MAG: 2-iminoacetate synthase ThiH [Muribaculaceae bacterium]|nr:2-iminoacetate synthase ThiH [Muribaculaceae bacterium]MDE6509617.1 2-iminoacetate synthase ThiH [Muribaculaceae bacterium]
MFSDELKQYDWDETTSRIAAKTARDVEAALGKETALSVDDFMALISPAARPYLEQMARKSRRITRERFGKTISMYIPLYVSNACTNHCVYCGFNHSNPLQRVTLTQEQVKAECEAIRRLGPFENLLIVSGEFPAVNGPDYLEQVLHTARPYFHNLTVEVMPLKQRDYERLAASGLNGVVCFQETYHREAYNQYHPRGMKSIFDWRVNGFDRMGAAGLHKIGMGVLIGLEDWRTDVTMMARHLQYLRKHYWRTRFSVNFPRMCPAEGGYQPKVVMTDAELAQLTFAFRLFDNDVDISYSTRESPAFRANMMQLGVTSMSAGSKTEPGGYVSTPDALEQFEVTDSRTPLQVAAEIAALGYEPVWKDWDRRYDG